MNLDDVIINSVVVEIKNILFEAAQYEDKEILMNSVRDIHSFLGCTECSLWSINHNSTCKGDIKDFSSTSLIYRETASYKFQNDTDFVHDLNEGLFKQVIYAEKRNNLVFVYDRDEVLCYGYRSRDFVEKCGLTQFIVIPIYNNTHTVIALFEISYQKCDIGKSVWEKISGIISSFFTTAINRVFSEKKQSLMANLIDCHRKHKNKEAAGLFKEIIRGVLLESCPAQGVSVFIWDNYQNRFYLTATKGLEGTPDPLEVFFQMGDGRTGEVGNTGNPIITDDIDKEGLDEVLGNHREVLKSPAKTAMFIPIKDPSREKDVIGVFRMVNKTNVCNDRYVDYFNDNDVDLMLDAADYMGLIVANYQKEEGQYDFIDKLTHEFTTPANAIWKTASRLYSHYSESDFMTRNLLPYLKNIIDFAEQQRWQASTNLFLSRNRRKQPFETRYNIKPTLLWEVIKKSIEIAIPIARKYDVPFRNIYLDSKSDKRLAINIDKDAFVSVFYNLYTNAIKYHDPENVEKFYIGTSYWIDNNKLHLKVEDNGIGIKQKDQSKIFEKGFRSESAIRINASGYGIGLTVIKQIVEDFGGEIKISNLKNPTIFHIELPINKILKL